MPTNYPESLREVFRHTTAIAVICEAELYPGAENMDVAATKIAAEVYLIWREGQRPEIVKDFFALLTDIPGKAPITKLTNFCIRDIKPRHRGLVQTSKNQIASTAEMLNEFWKPARRPNIAETLRRIEELSEGKGINELHRRWMSHLSNQARAKTKATEDLIELGKRAKVVEEAAAAGMTIAEYKVAMAAVEAKRKQAETEECWSAYVQDGVVIPVTAEWIGNQEVFISHGGKLIRLSVADTDRVRQCMLAA